MKILIIPFFAVFVFLNSCKEQVAKNELAEAEKTVELVTTFSNPTSENSATPRLFGNDSKLYLSWVTNQKDNAALNFAMYDGQAWNETKKVAKGNDWFNNWADFPTIIVNKQNILTTYLQKSAPDTYTYDIKINVFNDSLNKWKKNILLHTDGTKSEHGFVSAIADNMGGFYISWLDGRNTVGGGHHGDENEDRGAMTLRTANVSSLGIVTDEQEIDNRVCDCCGTSMAMTKNGPVVVFRDRSDEEIRDISIVRWVDGIWTKPQTVIKDAWKITGCPVNGPIISTFNEHVAVAWFTGVNEKPKVQIAFSDNSGETFGVPIRVDSNMTLGRVDVVMLNENEAAISWMEQMGKETLVQLMKVNSNGSKGKVITLSKTTAERASGFPQIKVLDGNIVTAMTITAKDKPTRIKTASIKIEDL